MKPELSRIFLLVWWMLAVLGALVLPALIAFIFPWLLVQTGLLLIQIVWLFFLGQTNIAPPQWWMKLIAVTPMLALICWLIATLQGPAGNDIPLFIAQGITLPWSPLITLSGGTSEFGQRPIYQWVTAVCLAVTCIPLLVPKIFAAKPTAEHTQPESDP